MNYDVTIQTVAWINGRRNDKSLIISPKFQRRPVWLEKERRALLSTICSALPFPEIYIQIVTDAESGRQEHVVVDGQQRVTTILMFVDGKVSLPEDTEWQGQSFKDLNEEQKKRFWDYKVVVRMLQGASDPEIRDLFTRLNTNNIALNDQELRNARYMGKFKACCERLADNPFFQSIQLFTAREVRRMEDIEFVSELLLRAVEGVTNKKDLLEQAYADYDEDFPQESEYEGEFSAAIQLLKSITTESNASLVKAKSNFFTLFGACLEYYRQSKKPFFSKPEAISTGVGRLLLSAKTFDPNAVDPNPVIRDYYDAVSRAASDKSRRVRREQILLKLIGEVETVALRQPALI